MNPSTPAPLREFIAAMTGLVERCGDEAELLPQARHHLLRLLESDAWLPAHCAAALPDRYAQYPLYVDARGRFSIVSFVWGPGQVTPVHNHRTWGLVGVLRGAERCVEYVLHDGHPQPAGVEHRLERGRIDTVSPRIGDWHQVANALDDQTSISIHVYGADIGRVVRQCLDAQGRLCDFVSGYSGAPLIV